MRQRSRNNLPFLQKSKSYRFTEEFVLFHEFPAKCTVPMVNIYSSEEGKVNSKITCLGRRIPAITITNNLVIPLTPLLLCNQKSGSNFPLFSYLFGKNPSFSKLNKTTKPFLIYIKTDTVIFLVGLSLARCPYQEGTYQI